MEIAVRQAPRDSVPSQPAQPFSEWKLSQFYTGEKYTVLRIARIHTWGICMHHVKLHWLAREAYNHRIETTHCAASLKNCLCIVTNFRDVDRSLAGPDGFPRETTLEVRSRSPYS